MKKFLYVLGLLIIVSLLIASPTSAIESVNGTLGTTAVLSTFYTTNPTGTGGNQLPLNLLWINQSQFTQGLTTLVRYDGPSNYRPTFTSNTPPGNTTPFNVTYDAGGGNIRLISTGTFGYQRAFNFLGQEQPGYQWFVFNNWNVSGITGNIYLTINYENVASLDGMYFNYAYMATASPPSGSICFVGPGNVKISGNYQKNTYLPFENRYTATKPSGLGIQGSVNKTGTTGTIYSSLVSIYNATDGALIGSDYTVNDLNFNFNIPHTGSIIIGVMDSSNQHFNSTPLFNITTPTPTPTPIPGPSNSTTTSLFIWDEGGNHINGANIHIKDIENGTWTNSTHDPDGRLSIETQRDHHLDLYADYDIFANEFLPTQLLNQETGPINSNYTYYLTLFDYNSLAPPGYTSLYVEVKDQQTHNYLDYSVVRATLPNGTYYTQSTSNLGHALFIVPNNTMINCAATQSGYLPGSILVNSTGASTFTTVIELSRQATPTQTPYIKPTLTPTPLITQVPGTTNGTYTGFWSPFYKGLHGMGADDGELGVIMTAVFAVFGLIGGAFSTGGNPRGASAGASLGFILSCAFKFINVWLVIVGVAWLLASFFLYRDG